MSNGKVSLPQNYLQSNYGHHTFRFSDFQNNFPIDFRNNFRKSLNKKNPAGKFI